MHCIWIWQLSVKSIFKIVITKQCIVRIVCLSSCQKHKPKRSIWIQHTHTGSALPLFNHSIITFINFEMFVFTPQKHSSVVSALCGHFCICFLETIHYSDVKCTIVIASFPNLASSLSDKLLVRNPALKLNKCSTKSICLTYSFTLIV